MRTRRSAASRDPYALEDKRRQSVAAAGGSVKVVVVADTHGEPHPRARDLVAAEAPSLILHAGDVGAPSILGELASVAPTIAVRGNIDARVLPDAVTIDFVDGDDALFTLLLVHVAVNGPKLRADAARLAKGEGAHLVVCGHSHVPFIGRDKDLGVFNPGSIGPRRFHLPIVFGVMELSAGRLALRHVDCETGQTWLP